MKGKSLLVTVWVVGVVAASFATWRVIDAAGRQILTEPYQPVLSTQSQEPSDSPTSQPASPSKSASPDKGNGGKGHQQSSSAPPPTTSQPSPTPAVTRTWRSDPGSVVASCSAGTVTLDSITPNNGYQWEISNDKTTQATVHFEPKSDRGSEVTLSITCSGGVPQFATGGGD